MEEEKGGTTIVLICKIYVDKMSTVSEQKEEKGYLLLLLFIDINRRDIEDSNTCLE